MNPTQTIRFGSIVRAALATLLTLALPVAAGAGDQSARIIEVTVEHAVVVPMTGVTHVLVVDDTICQVDVEKGTLRVSALKRGETVVVVWKNEQTENLLVRVTAPVAAPAAPRITTEERDAMGHGTVGSLVNIAAAPGGMHTTSMMTPFAWTQGSARNRFSTSGQMQGMRSAETADLNLDTLTAQWVKGAATLQILDYTTSLDGGPAARVGPAGSASTFALRGADLGVKKGKNSYELFAGTTLPSFAASRRVAGINFARQASERVSIETTSAVVRVPVVADGTVVDRDVSLFQTVGVTNRLSERAAFQIRGGAGTDGFYAQGATSWTGERVSAFATATGSSPQFGLNRLQLVYAPNVSIEGGSNFRLTRRFRVGGGYSHTATQATPLVPASSTSDHLSSTVNVTLSPAHTVFANAVWNRNRGGLGISGELTGRRFDTGISSQFGSRIANNIQLSLGALADPLQLDSRSQFTVRDTATVVVPRGVLNVSFSHDHLNPSVVARLRQQLNLLAPGLQPLFLNDPLGFVQSALMPADVRQLLASLEPVDTQAVVSGQFRVSSKLTVNPTVSYLHHAQSSTLKTGNVMLGYSLAWKVTPTFELQSTLSNTLVFDPRRKDLARTTVLGIGFRKTFNGAPRWIAPSAGYRIQGRVFRDLNIDGVADRDEQGMAGVTVSLSNGKTARTDDQGRYEFKGLPAGEYRVILPLDQLGLGARVTTPIDPVLRLYERRTLDADFGVINFSRVIGNVFNDYALDGVRHDDAPGIRGVEIIITGQGVERRVKSDGGGDFEINDLAPGRYRVTVDGMTVPPNHACCGAGLPDIDVTASSTTTISVPVRALRAITGRVLMKKAANDAPSPLKGVRIMTQGATAVTDENGCFVLRNLPAGDLTVSVVPVSALPGDLTAPAGRVRMPKEPLQIDDASIVLENPRLIPYLVPAADNLPR